jgi:succinyl-diaminopimelate desuccinylase
MRTGVERAAFPSCPAEVKTAIDASRSMSEPISGDGEAAVLQRLTVNLGAISGGSSMNLVPNQATAALDIRLPMGITASMVIEHLSEVLTSEGISREVVKRYDPSWTSPSEDIVRCAAETARQMTEAEAVVNMRVGASDTRLFRRKGIPSVVVELTPFDMGGPDEHLLVEELMQVAQIHGVAALRFLQP